MSKSSNEYMKGYRAGRKCTKKEIEEQEKEEEPLLLKIVTGIIYAAAVGMLMQKIWDDEKY